MLVFPAVAQRHANVLEGLNGLLFRASLLLNGQGKSHRLLKCFKKARSELFIAEVKVPVWTLLPADSHPATVRFRESIFEGLQRFNF